MKIPLGVLRWRRAVQVTTLAVLCVLPVLNAHGWNGIMGDFYALRLGAVPFADPLGVAQLAAAGAWPGWRLWAGAGLALLLAAILGRVFCGWLCPYGLFSEWVWALRGHRLAKPLRTSQSEWLWRGGLTLAGLAATAWWGAPLLNALSAPGTISLAPKLAWTEWQADTWGLLVAVGGALLLPVALLVLEVFTGRRWWCRYACPQALLLMLAARCGRFGVRWTASGCSCKGVPSPCEASCSLALRMRAKGGPPRDACVQCGDCVKTCARHGGALRME